MIWMVKFYHLENSGKSFFGFWLSFKVHSNLILLKSLLSKIKKKKIKLTVMGIPDSWWPVGSVLQLLSCNKWFYESWSQ